MREGITNGVGFGGLQEADVFINLYLTLFSLQLVFLQKWNIVLSQEKVLKPFFSKATRKPQKEL